LPTKDKFDTSLSAPASLTPPQQFVLENVAFSKLPKQVSCVASPVNTTCEIECDGSTSYIGDIDMLPEPTLNGATTANKLRFLLLQQKWFAGLSKSNAPPKEEEFVVDSDGSNGSCLCSLPAIDND